jgi:hypothetical protein
MKLLIGMTFAATLGDSWPQVAVARQDHRGAVDMARGGADHGAGAGLDAVDLAEFVDADPGLGRRLRQADGVVQRVQVARVAVDLAADIIGRADQAADAGAVERFEMGVAVVAVQLFGIGVGLADLGFRRQAWAMPGWKVTGMAWSRTSVLTRVLASSARSQSRWALSLPTVFSIQT